MPQVTVHDHALWFSHIVDGEALVQRLSSLKAGASIVLEVNDVVAGAEVVVALKSMSYGLDVASKKVNNLMNTCV